MNKRRLFILLSISLIFLGSAQIAAACGCYSHATVLEDFEKSDVVVIARIVSLDPATEPGLGPGADIQSAKLVVEKVYKGSVKINEELTFAQGDEILGCTWSFVKQMSGNQYLLYLFSPDKPSEPWYASTCNRSRALEYANEDLLYLNNMDQRRGRTRISGRFDENGADGLSLEGRKIRIIGRHKTYIATTDKNGVYEIYDVPPGYYVLEPELPFGWHVEEFRLTRPPRRSEMDRPAGNRVGFALQAHKHFGIGIQVDLSNYVSGTVRDSSGKPLDDVCVSLAPATVEGYLVCNSLTDEKGRFQIDSVEAGTYVIIFNNEYNQGADKSLPRLYYPGVAERANAETITIKHGESKKNLNVVIQKASSSTSRG